MTIQTTTHLNFRGQARAALSFYQSVFGGELMAISYADAGVVQDPAEAGQVMWGEVRSAAGFAIMAYDVPSRLAYAPGEIPVFVSVRDEDKPRAVEIGRTLAGLGFALLLDLGWRLLAWESRRFRSQLAALHDHFGYRHGDGDAPGG